MKIWQLVSLCLAFIFFSFSALLSIQEEQHYQKVKKSCLTYGYSDAQIDKYGDWCIRVLDGHTEIKS